MLNIVGTGLSSDDINVKAISLIENSDEVYLENYTSLWNGSKEDIKKITGKDVFLLDREKVESDYLIEKAKEKNISLLVIGDPLSATTHFELLLECKKNNIDFQIVHAPTVFSVVNETGLQLYKFGETVTIPFFSENFKPTSWFEKIKENQKRGLHTLCLFDIKRDENRFMNIEDAVDVIKQVGDIDKAIACSCLGTEKRKIVYDFIDNLKNMEPPCCLIIPGKLHFKEEEALGIL
jgi:diphthine synthase